MDFRPVTCKKLALIAAALTVSCLAGAGAAAASGSTGQPLVYICPDTQGHPSRCANGQELEVFDRNGIPIASVGETGGIGVFGDNSSVYRPGDIFHAALTGSYGPPKAGSACRVPAAWIAPQGVWSCTSGHWVQKIRF